MESSQYAHPRAPINGTWDQSWFSVWYEPKDICSSMTGNYGKGASGYNGFCTLDSLESPTCECLPGFSHEDPNNKFSGCKQDKVRKCEPGELKPEELYEFHEVSNIFWPSSSSYEKFPLSSEDECSRSCFRDCNCVVAVIKLGNCWKKKLPLSNGRLERDTYGKALVKVPKSDDILWNSLVLQGIEYFGNKYSVKKLDKLVKEGEKEFKTEAIAIAKTHHKNLVRLIGFCDEGPHRLLVYEFMSNGTLASFVFGISRPDLNKRMQMAVGIARGLVISDFGLAKLLMGDETRTQTATRRTKGYVAPEWFRSKPVMAKVNVYSYGVMLLKIICCRKNVELERENEEDMILTDVVYHYYKRKRLAILVENDGEARNNMKRVERLVMVAIWCIQEDPSLRPTHSTNARRSR
ncbi:hypothetical protein RHSIM_Rhsim07G0051200 [Rhododendron simsii]|uniref:Protein kinase domain-containing protein n=1 Tax=Rhododendron simsii TaxID=118357 RepID=A0A834GNN9_RHOSS|nr:hypothetical protein RHSIM_Rhsim07G0051200 [Rhododendron simsii]